MKSLYYPIDSQNLFFVFSHGCICPACLYGERLGDVQSRNQTFVLFTEAKKIPTESNVRIEVKVTDSERNSMLKCGKYLLYSGILPISRIVSIAFRDNINNVRTQVEANTAYLPNRLFAKRADKNLCSNDQVENAEINPKVEEVARLKTQYDKVLGGMALAAIAGRRDTRMSLNFSMYLSYFNPLVMEILAENKVEFKSPFDNSSYKAVSNYIKQSSIISKDTVRESAAAEGQVIPRTGITKKEDFSSLTGAPYLFYILYNYKANDLDNDGNGTDKIDSLICKRFDGVKDKELSAYCYGRHRGYVVFRKAYGDVPCKFKLDNYVDYIIIESIFKMVCKEHPDSAYYTSLLKEVTNGIPKPSDLATDNAFRIFGYSVKKPDPIQYPSAKWFCRFFAQQRNEQEIEQEYERLVAYFNQDKAKSNSNEELVRKLNEDLCAATQKIKMLEEGVGLDERVIEAKDRQISKLSSDNDALRLTIDSLRRELEEQQAQQLDDMPAEICEPRQDNSSEIEALKARIAELEEENFQFSKKIDELEKEEKTQTSDGYLDLGIDFKEQKEMSEIKSILNRAFELYGKQNAVLAALVSEKHFYANDKDDKKSLITKLILIEKGLRHD